jgi:hypothetical protein
MVLFNYALCSSDCGLSRRKVRWLISNKLLRKWTVAVKVYLGIIRWQLTKKSTKSFQIESRCDSQLATKFGNTDKKTGFQQ